MPSSPDLKPALTFLAGIKRNNNKLWFEKNRSAYEQARGEFEDLVDQLILGLGSIEDLKGITAKDCVMRIYRDVRFSKDKSPYKINLAADIAPGGRKSGRLGYYLHIEPGNASMAAGGLHMPESAQISRFRVAIDRDARKFKAITSDKTFVRYFGSHRGGSLKTAPQGYSREHPEIKLLRLKEVVAAHSLSDEDVLSPGLATHVLKVFAAMKPFLDYLNALIA